MGSLPRVPPVEHPVRTTWSIGRKTVRDEGRNLTEEPRIAKPGVDTDLGMIGSAIEALRDLALDPRKAQDGDRVYDFSIKWGVLLSGRLKRLEHYHREGGLTEDQRSHYRELRRDLKGAIPLMERLGLGKPRVPLED
jgi:hypothetical protein